MAWIPDSTKGRRYGVKYTKNNSGTVTTRSYNYLNIGGEGADSLSPGADSVIMVFNKVFDTTVGTVTDRVINEETPYIYQA